MKFIVTFVWLALAIASISAISQPLQREVDKLEVELAEALLKRELQGTLHRRSDTGPYELPTETPETEAVTTPTEAPASTEPTTDAFTTTVSSVTDKADQCASEPCSSCPCNPGPCVDNIIIELDAMNAKFTSKSLKEKQNIENGYFCSYGFYEEFNANVQRIEGNFLSKCGPSFQVIFEKLELFYLKAVTAKCKTWPPPNPELPTLSPPTSETTTQPPSTSETTMAPPGTPVTLTSEPRVTNATESPENSTTSIPPTTESPENSTASIPPTTESPENSTASIPPTTESPENSTASIPPTTESPSIPPTTTPEQCEKCTSTLEERISKIEQKFFSEESSIVTLGANGELIEELTPAQRYCHCDWFAALEAELAALKLDLIACDELYTFMATSYELAYTQRLSVFCPVWPPVKPEHIPTTEIITTEEKPSTSSPTAAPYSTTAAPVSEESVHTTSESPSPSTASLVSSKETVHTTAETPPATTAVPVVTSQYSSTSRSYAEVVAGKPVSEGGGAGEESSLLKKLARKLNIFGFK